MGLGLAEAVVVAIGNHARSRGLGCRIEDGKAWQGFRQTECLMVEDHGQDWGPVWIRRQPIEAHHRYGHRYVTLDTTGPHSDVIVRLVAEVAEALGDWGFCKRLDVAFDFTVAEDFEGAAVREMVRAAKPRGRFRWERNGEWDVETVYVNKPKRGQEAPERMARFYRKDREDPLVKVPTMRVELELRERRSQQLWKALRQGGMAELKRSAAFMCREWLGLNVGDGDAPPAPDVEPKSDLAARLAQFISQHVVPLLAARRAGKLSGEGFWRLVESASRKMSRRSAARLRAEERALQESLWCDFESLVKGHLG